MKMNKLKSAILYECSTKIKPICIFYLIQYAITALIFAIVAICVGTENLGSNALEISSVVFVSIIGVLGYKEDFKALLQNGFTRKYIFLSTIFMFVFMSGTMALVDVIVGNTLHYFMNGYFTLFGALYGYGNVFVNWVWLTALYLMFCSIFYLGVLIINKAGKKVSLYLGIALGCIVVLIIALFRFVISSEVTGKITAFLMKAMGFMGDGTINRFFPIITLLLIGTVLGAASYAVIRRTELK